MSQFAASLATPRRPTLPQPMRALFGRDGQSLVARAFASTDAGQHRAHNEDSFLIDDDLRLYAVADGMGGHAGGSIASRLATDTLHEEMSRDMKSVGAAALLDGDHPVLRWLPAAVRRANAAIRMRGEHEPLLEGMGATLTALCMADQIAVIAHVGDSRAYLIRDQLIAQITDDHSMVAAQVRAGRLTAEQAQRSPFKNIITRALGMQPDVVIDTMPVAPRAGDVWVLCSDGLSNYVLPGEILHLVSTTGPEDAARPLIELANARGGDDNITALVIALSRVAA